MQHRTDTLVHSLAAWAKKTPDTFAIYDKDGRGNWQKLTWKQYWEAAREVGRGLLALGHEPGECVALVGTNRIDWVLCEFGIMAARGIPAPIYTTLLHDQVAWIVNHSEARIAICDGPEQLAKYLQASAEGLMPRVEKFICFDDPGVGDERVMTLDELRALGRQQDEAALDARLDAIQEDETGMLIYTSGTTGQPKAVQLEHGGMLFMGEALLHGFDTLKEEFRLVSYLPLCHVAEQLFTNFLHICTGGEVYFCPDLKQIKDYLVEVRPTVFLGVPRVWEKFQAVLSAKLSEATGIKGMIASWARNKELSGFREDVRTGVQEIGFLRARARSMVADKIKGALGLDQLRIAATGAAPIGIATLEFFASLGIVIYEGYGMSETTGVATASEYMKPKFGTVGKPVRGVEVRLAEDQEILLKGRNMTRGYLRQPEKTKELIDEEGWLHTGDLGSFDEDGYLRITGRKKDLIITAGGKNIAPSEMEGYIKEIPGISQAVVVGDAQPFLSALVTLDGESLDDLASRVGVAKKPLPELARDETVQRWVQAQVDRVCNARVARYQTIKKTFILPVEFTVDSGEITPTMKIKRNVVNEKFADEIAAFYRGRS